MKSFMRTIVLYGRLQIGLMPINRYFNRPAFKSRNDVVFHALDCPGLTMHEKCSPWRTLESAQPSQDFTVVAMRREAVDDMHLGANGIIHSENAELPRPF